MRASPQIISRARCPWNSSILPSSTIGASSCVHVVRHAMVGGQQIVQRVGVASRAGCHPERRVIPSDATDRSSCRGSMRDEVAQLVQARLVVVHRVVRDAADLGVRHRAAERLAVDRLAGGALHEVRTAEPHERRALHHDDEVGERRQIRAARDARPHHRGELRNAQVAPHDRIVIEQPARAVLARETRRPGTAGSRPPNRRGR